MRKARVSITRFSIILLHSLPIPKTVEGRYQIGAIRIVVETLFWYLEVASPDVNVLSAKWKISECTRD